MNLSRERASICFQASFCFMVFLVLLLLLNVWGDEIPNDLVLNSYSEQWMRVVMK